MTDTNSSSRRVVIPESLMGYLRQYGEKFSCDDLSGIVIRVIQDHQLRGLSTALDPIPHAAPPSLQATAPPDEVPPSQTPRFSI